MTNFTTDSKGWTWVFRKGKSHNSKPIDNPFVKDLEKIATSFYVSNFPDSLDAKGLWKVCQPFGRIVDAFIANKRSKLGKRFGFVRFLGVSNVDNFVKTLSNIWIGSYHLYCSVSRFQRSLKRETNSTHQNATAHSHPVMSSYEPYIYNAKRSYVSVAQGENTSKETTQEKVKTNLIHLDDSDLIKVDDISKVALVKMKNVDTISNLYHLCKNEGFVGLKILYVGGLWIWFQFNSEAACAAFKANASLKKLWTAVRTVSPSFKVDERMIWLEIHGLPLCAWGSNAYKKVANHFGRFMFFDSDFDTCMGLGRVCIATKRQSFISESAKVVTNGEPFEVHVQEVGSWSINISDDSESLDKEDASFEDDNKSVNGVDKNLEELDDLDIMKPLEEPLEEHICNNNMNIEADHIEDVSDDSCPPGFENATYCHNKVPTPS